MSQALFPWVAGFQHAMESFPDLVELPDPAIDVALARLYRHLPAQTDEEREVVATLDAEHPLATLDEAIEDLIVIVADLEDLTRERRYKVETIRREAPKAGRNEPCPCGSGRKYKHCHGQG
ncbi:SEC-C metal-binding domain-containing protein [Piscinibacter sp.]|uniref:SEC-C metal-binding domain-containing protein n=1 Tax=Piscinibacter sp. TaxID=1903157 RepID=UPI0039E630FE